MWRMKERWLILKFYKKDFYIVRQLKILLGSCEKTILSCTEIIPNFNCNF
jgi:hypothetical protein